MKTTSQSTKSRTGSTTCVIYCRVSTSNQANGNSVSLEAQESLSKKMAKLKGYRIKSTHKEVKSAYSSSMKSLKEILTSNRNTHILLYDVSRFCRNVSNGIAMLNLALSKNNTLVFVHDKLVINKTNKTEKMQKLVDLLEQSENESRRIGSRIKTAQKYLRDQGKYAGGAIPFGHKVLKTDDDNNNSLVEDPQEQNIMMFISLCRMKEISSEKLNQLMNAISPQVPYAPINCYDKDQVTVLKTINTSLTYSEIADLLNDYSVKKRGRKWTSSSVSSTKAGTSLEFKMSNLKVTVKKEKQAPIHLNDADMISIDGTSDMECETPSDESPATSPKKQPQQPQHPGFGTPFTNNFQQPMFPGFGFQQAPMNTQQQFPGYTMQPSFGSYPMQYGYPMHPMYQPFGYPAHPMQPPPQNAPEERRKSRSNRRSRRKNNLD